MCVKEGHKDNVGLNPTYNPYFTHSNLFCVLANTRPKLVAGGLVIQDSFFTKQIDSVCIIVDETSRA